MERLRDFLVKKIFEYVTLEVKEFEEFFEENYIKKINQLETDNVETQYFVRIIYVPKEKRLKAIDLLKNNYLSDSSLEECVDIIDNTPSDVVCNDLNLAKDLKAGLCNIECNSIIVEVKK